MNFFGCLSREAAESKTWEGKASSAELNVVPVLAAWSDVCGVGALLEKHRWDLNALRESGAFAVLSRVRVGQGSPLFIGANPEPSERVLIINDGVARTLDVGSLGVVHPIRVIFYVRDLFLKHFAVKSMLTQCGLGLRTILASGERCQYAPPGMTGESVLTYTHPPSAYGKAILKQQFVYNPLEFQMNTGFALAYSLDAAGSKEGLTPNHVYVERGWFEALERCVPGLLKIGRGCAQFMIGDATALSLGWEREIAVKCFGRYVDVFKVSTLNVHVPLEGEEVTVELDGEIRANDNGCVNPKLL